MGELEGEKMEGGGKLIYRNKDKSLEGMIK